MVMVRVGVVSDSILCVVSDISVVSYITNGSSTIITNDRISDVHSIKKIIKSIINDDLAE